MCIRYLFYFIYLKLIISNWDITLNLFEIVRTSHVEYDFTFVKVGLYLVPGYHESHEFDATYTKKALFMGLILCFEVIPCQRQLIGFQMVMCNYRFHDHVVYIKFHYASNKVDNYFVHQASVGGTPFFSLNGMTL